MGHLRDRDFSIIQRASTCGPLIGSPSVAYAAHHLCQRPPLSEHVFKRPKAGFARDHDQPGTTVGQNLSERGTAKSCQDVAIALRQVAPSGRPKRATVAKVAMLKTAPRVADDAKNLRAFVQWARPPGLGAG
jgi:hypothetical protein